MSNDELSAVEAALAQSRRKEAIFWLAITTLLVTAVAVVVLLSRSSAELRRRLDEASTQIGRLRDRSEEALKQSEQLKIQIAKTTGVLSALESKQDILASDQRISQGLTHDLKTGLSEQQRRLELQNAQSKQVAALQTAIGEKNQQVDRSTKDALAQLQELRGQVAQSSAQAAAASRGAGEATKQADDLLTKLNQRDARLDNVEQELKSAHFVFNTKHDNVVSGMDIIVRFHALKRGQQPGPEIVTNLEVTSAQSRKTLFARKELPVGDSVSFKDEAGNAYTLTARYALRFLAALDRVGFDINRYEKRP